MPERDEGAPPAIRMRDVRELEMHGNTFRGYETVLDAENVGVLNASGNKLLPPRDVAHSSVKKTRRAPRKLFPGWRPDS